MGKYDFEMNTEPGTTPMLIMDQITPGADVLEFGCANGRMTKYLRDQKGCRVSVVELEEEPFRCAMQFAADGICTDIETGAWQEYYVGKQFDYIIFADVLEHLRTAERVLAETKGFLKHDGKVLISIPNIAHNDVIALLFNNSFAYREIGLLDNTHVHFWGEKELQSLAENTGFFVEILDGSYNPPFMTELKDAAETVPDALKTLLNGREYNEVYQFFLVLRKKEWADKNGLKAEVKLKKSGTRASAIFYWDLGRGYHTELFTAVEGDGFQEERTFRVEDIPQDCKKVRFDPPAEGVFLVEKCHAITNDGEVCDLVPLNGIRVNHETYLFRNVHAQMEFALPERAVSFTLMAKIKPCLENDAEHLIAIYQNKEEECVRHNEELVQYQTVIAQNGEELIRYKDALIRSTEELSQYREALARGNEELTQCKAELTQCKAELTQQIEENNTVLRANQLLLVEKSMLEQQKRAAEQLYDSLAQGYIALEAEYESVKGQFFATNEYKKAYEELVPDYRQLALQYEQVYGQYVAISNSQFWRMTAPFRRVLDRVKATKLGTLIHKTAQHYRMFGLRITMQKIKQYLKKKKQKPIGTAVEENQGDTPLLRLQDMVKAYESAGASICLKEEIMKMEHSNCVLIVSHELDLTGAPVAIEHMANILRTLGKEVVVVSPHEGALRGRFTAAGIPTIVFDPVYRTNLVKRSAFLFDLIVVSTNVGAPLIGQLSELSVPVMWWIHEARASYFDAAVKAMPQEVGSNIHIYCGGAYAQNLLKEYRPDYPSEILLYCTPDQADPNKAMGVLDLSAADGKTVFALVGMLEQRKGQNILAEAIRKLPADKREQCYFVLVGRQCYPPQYAAVVNLRNDFPDNVRYIEQLKREELACLYDRMECLICASLDDPMPIVVADALSLSKCVICSENTGSAKLLEEMSSGLIYHNNDAAELAGCIEAVLDGVDDLETMGARARATYEAYFTEKIFKSNLARIINQIAPNPKAFGSLAQMYLPGPEGILREIYGQDLLQDYSKREQKNILLFSHELSLTGGPVVLHKMAHVFRKQGHNVTILSPFDGPLREKYEKDRFPVILFEDVYDTASNDFLSVYGADFDLIVINTVVTYRAVAQLSGLLTPVVWWIHDSHASYTYGGFGKCLPAKLPPNVKILCGGNYAKRQLLHYYPHYKAEEMLYAIDDCAKIKGGTIENVKIADRKLFLIIGTIELRKGQDIAVQAIRNLSEEERNKCQFVFMGKVIEEPVMEVVKELCDEMPECVRYMKPISHDDLISLYRQADCLICSSRDDPMPVVVTEMQALSKAVICSENTGTAALLKKHGGGLIYGNDDPEKLAQKIVHIANFSRKELSAIGKEARGMYEACFSSESFERELAELVKEQCSEEHRINMATVSVVIPSYNAGPSFRETLTRLKSQKGLGEVEVVAVDSGSSDGTQQIVVECGAKLIQISQAEFSHSYARNLGAQNATGQILLFMTQDAMPSDENWVRGMVLPILKGEVSATSCRERCPEGTDLYYRVAAWNHANYLDISKESQIGCLVPGMSPEELRKKASLNDVSTAIDRKQFQKMKYRHSFAEDLDMGIRLLKDGKSIKLLNEPTVIHGHTRPASYYLRRGLAEGRALEQIMGVQEADISAQTLAEMIINGYSILQRVMVQIQTESDVDSVTAFGERFIKLIQQEMTNPQDVAYGQRGADAVVEDCVQKLAAFRPIRNRSNIDLAHMVMYYWSNVLSIYLQETGWAKDGDLKVQICDCIYKQMALVMGNCLAHMDPAEDCFREFQKLANGV